MVVVVVVVAVVVAAVSSSDSSNIGSSSQKPIAKGGQQGDRAAWRQGGRKGGRNMSLESKHDSFWQVAPGSTRLGPGAWGLGTGNQDVQAACTARELSWLRAI